MEIPNVLEILKVPKSCSIMEILELELMEILELELMEILKA